jgi:amidase
LRQDRQGDLVGSDGRRIMLKPQAIEYSTASAGALARALAERQVSALELFEAAVARIEAENPKINAVVVRDYDRAREAARAADDALARGEVRPLLGVPMTVKESNNIAGLPTTWGFAEFAGWTARSDAVAVARLKAAGAVILGKTNVPPGLADWQSANPIYGRTNNPHDLGRSPGGSSGGSAAALASGMVPLEFGSDIGGSIRVPAHFCGVFGHKPTHGLIPSTGHSPPGAEGPGSAPEFGVVGPLARSAADLSLALQVTAGPDGDLADAYRLSLKPARGERLSDFRVLILDAHPACRTASDVQGALHRTGEALSRAGAAVSYESPLTPDLAGAHDVYQDMLFTIFAYRAQEGRKIDAWAWLEGMDSIARHRAAWRALFEQFDVVLAPPWGAAAFPHDPEPDQTKRRLMIDGEPTRFLEQLAWPGAAAFPGLPATCAPIASTSEGLPIGTQIIGPRYGDLTTIAFAGLLEREIGRV